MATVTRTGVKWIKASKTDALGNSYNNSWRLNDSIRLNYSTPGNTQYTVNSVTEYPTYWLLGLDYVGATSSLQGAKDYKVTATKKIANQTFLAGQSSSVTGYTETIDSQSFFDATNGLYGQGNTINIPLIVTASFYCDTTAGNKAYPFVRMILTNEVGVSLGEPPVLEYVYTGEATEPNLQVTLTGSFVPQYYSGIYYKFEVGNSASATHKVDVTSVNTEFNLLITQSVAPASNTLTILDPFITQPFEGTDCDVTYGWVQSYPYSQYFMDMDYSNSTTIPVNQQLLISGTATPALVKDYYYESQRHVLPRYKGSRASSLKYNEYTGPLDENVSIGTPYGDYPLEGYQGDISYGKVAAIDQYKSYAARFQYIAGYGPERYGALLAYVTDLIDENGNIAQPRLGDYTYYNLVNSFEQGEQAIVKLLDAQGDTQFASLNNTFTIVRSGKRIDNILFTYTASLSASLGLPPLEGIAFEGVNNTNLRVASNYSASWEYGSNNLIQGKTVALNSASLQTRINSRFINGEGYKLQSGDDLPNNNSPLTFRCSILSYGNSTQGAYNLQLVKSSTSLSAYPTSSTGTYTTVKDFGYVSFRFENNSSNIGLDEIRDFVASGVDVEEGYYYTFLVRDADPLSNFRIKQWYASVEQDIPFNAASIYNVQYSTDKYLLTSSTDKSILSASSALTSYYGKTQVDLTGTGSGFNKPIPFTLQEGDEIRFLGDESKVHMIYNVNYGVNFLTFNINPALPTSSYNIQTVNSFSIRRYTDDPNTVILQGTKAAGGTPSGIIEPKYKTQALQNAINNSDLFQLQSGQGNS